MNADEGVSVRTDPERTLRQREVAEFLAYSAGDPHDPLVLATGLQSLAKAVVTVHFRSFPGWEELISIGVEKGLRILRAPHFDPSKNVRNYLYTGMRNEVGNYLRRESKTISVESTSACFGSVSDQKGAAVLGVEFEKQRTRIQERLRCCGVGDDRYRELARGAALYRAIL